MELLASVGVSIYGYALVRLDILASRLYYYLVYQKPKINFFEKAKL